MADGDIAAILRETRTIAIVGASPNEARPSNAVARYLKEHGYRIIPINPGAVGGELCGEPFVESIAAIPRSLHPIEMVDVFRTSEACVEVVQEAVTALGGRGLRTMWMQLGVINEEAKRIAAEAGLQVVMDRCVEIEHARMVNSTGYAEGT